MDVEAELISYLAEKLGVPVYGNVPEDRPETFATVQRTGGATERYRQLPIVTVDWWAPTRARASTLRLAGVEALKAFADDGPSGVCKVAIDSSYDQPDPDSGQPRYQTTCQITATV